ncbi:MAG: ribonuclease III [Gammaproteobacteria bacterium]
MRSPSGSDLDALQRALGHSFQNRDLLLLALTHRSVSGSRNNERLEFLGDSVLGHVIAADLFTRFPAASEGQLTRARARLVNGETLSQMAVDLDLGNHVRLGPGELKSGAFRRTSILADCVEALIGAIYLDAGLEAARRCVLAWYAPRLASLDLEHVEKDPKTRLQEYLQARGLPLPRYEVLETTGKSHAQQFRVSCTVDGLAAPASAWGGSRRIAEQVAAGYILESLTGEKVHER